MSDTAKDNSINRRLKVLEQKLSGTSYREIAKALKISHTTAKRDYEQALTEQFEYNSEEINRQRNKAQLILDKMIESNSIYAFGHREMNTDIMGRPKEFDPEEHGMEEVWINKKTGKRISDHHNLDSHYDYEEEEWVCEETCVYKERRLTGKELQQVKEKWIDQNSYYTKPSREHQKTLLECIKLMKDIWGFNSGTSTVFDQRKQTIQIKGQDEIV